MGPEGTRATRTYQDMIDNHFGNAGGTMRIRATDYEVELSDRGTWEYLNN